MKLTSVKIGGEGMKRKKRLRLERLERSFIFAKQWAKLCRLLIFFFSFSTVPEPGTRDSRG